MANLPADIHIRGFGGVYDQIQGKGIKGLQASLDPSP